MALNIILGLIMFGVSLGLHPADFKRVFEKPVLVLLGLLLQYLVLPVITLIVCLLLEVPVGLSFGLMLVMVSPGGNMSNFLTKMAKGDVALSVTLTAITTLLSAVATPKLFNWYASFLGNSTAEVAELSMLSMAKIVLMLTAFPLAAGMLFTYYLPRWSAKIEPLMKNGSLLLFALLLVFAFLKNKETFTANVGAVFFLVALVNGLALFLGYLLPRFLKVSAYRSKALAIETGIKNSGLSLVLVFNFWDGWGEPALVAAWWGVWHLLTGLAVAWLWSRWR